MTEHAVVIAGGGPTGLMLAGELALAGIDVVIVERRASQDLIGSRSGGLHARTIEIFDQRGIADRFISEGQKAQVAGFAGTRLDISDFPTRHNYGLALWQRHIERILAGWVGELAVPILRGREVTGFDGDDTGVDVWLSDGTSLRTAYLVGCDGGRSVVRKAAGIAFPGSDPTTSNLIAEVEVTGEPEWGIRRDARGIHALSKLDDGVRIGVMVTEAQVGATTEPTLRDLSVALVDAYGTDYGIHSPVFISRFTDATRQAAAYREGRVLLAGDAAHIHPPDGGQGLQTGVGDAVNLGWKMAQVVKGTSPDGLLDTYQAERHPIAARVLHTTMASVALRRDDERTKAARETVGELLAMDEPRRRFGAEMSGSGHPLRPRRGPPTARSPDARSRPGHRRRPAARLHAPARGPAGLHHPRGAPRRGHLALGGSRPVGRGQLHGHMGASGDRYRAGSDGGPRSARRVRGVGGRGESGGTGRRAHTLVRPAGRGLGSGPYAGISPLDAFRAPSSRAVMTPPPMIATIPAT